MSIVHPFVRSDATIPLSRPALRQSTARSGSQGWRRESAAPAEPAGGVLDSNLIAGDGTKNGFPASNKEPATNQKHDLTGKAPYRFESGSLQRGVRCEPDFRRRIPS